MRGPIIEEHLTNGTIANGDSVEYFVKSDGRLPRFYTKYTATATSSTVVFKLSQVAHFSYGKQTVSWPTNGAGSTDGIVTPSTGNATSSTAATHLKSILVCNDGAISEYRIKLTNNSGADITGVYILSELV